MADIELKCAACGKHHVFSEYSDVDSRRCGQCGAPLATATSAEEDPLSLNRAPPLRPKLGGWMYGGQSREIPEGHAILQGRAEHAEERMATQPKVGPVVRYAVLVAVALLMIIPQWLGRGHEGMLAFYLNYRYVLIGIAVVLALYDALKDSVLQAIFCLIIPFYIIFYAFYRVDSYWRSGFVMGVLAGTVSESFLIASDSLFAALNREMMGVISYISRLIAGA